MKIQDDSTLNWIILGPLLAIVSIDSMGSGIVLPLLPFYSQKLGASAVTIGLLVSVFAFFQFIAGLLLGPLSDKYGAKKILFVSQIGTFFSFILLALAPSLSWVFAARILDGLTAGNMSVAIALAVSTSGPKMRKQAIGIVSAGIGIGMMVGPALSSFSSQVSITAPIWIAAAVSVMSAIGTLILLPPQSAQSKATSFEKHNVWSVLKMPEAASLQAVFFLFYFAIAMMIGGLALFLSARFSINGKPFGAREVGFVFTTVGLINVIVQLFLMKQVSKIFSDFTIVLSSFALIAIGYFGYGLSTEILTLSIAIIGTSLGTAFLRPTLMGSLSSSVPRSRQGLVLGVNQAVMAAANVLGPFIGNALIEAKLYTIWASAIGSLMFVGGYAAFLLTRRFPHIFRRGNPSSGGEINEAIEITGH